MVLLLPVGLGACGGADPSGDPGAPTVEELRAEFARVDVALHALLLPNSMARTAPRSAGEIERHFRAIEAGVDFFRNHAGVPFLAGILAGAGGEDGDPGLTALQILHMMGTPDARRLVRAAEDSGNGAISDRARRMGARGEDLLAGFGRPAAGAGD